MKVVKIETIIILKEVDLGCQLSGCLAPVAGGCGIGTLDVYSLLTQ